MKLYALILLVFGQLAAGPMGLDFNLHVETFFGEGCSVTSSGAPVACSTFDGPFGPLAFGIANASRTVNPGFLSFSLHGDARATGEAGLASAGANYDYLLGFPTAASGVITGEYFVQGLVTVECLENPLGVGIRQGAASASFSDCNGSGPGGYPDQLVMLNSPFIAGHTLEISGSALVLASTPPSPINADLSFELIGFFDQAGNQVAFAPVSEPNLWAALAFALVLICGLSLRTV